MVTRISKRDRTLYVCDVCGMAYEEKGLAERCQAWCEQYHSCNLEIIAHAVPADD